MCVELSELAKGCGPVMGGVDIVRVGKTADLTADPALGAGTQVISGNLAMAEGSGTYQVATAQDKSQLNTTQQGEVDYMSLRSELTFEVPGAEMAKRYLLARIKNDDLFFLVKTTDGSWHMIGTKSRPTKVIEYNDNRGMAAADGQKIIVKVKWDSDFGPMGYNGTIPPAPEEIES
jgi:hypothetical protein